MIGGAGPIGAGVGLRQPHVEGALAQREPSLWFEVHTENYMMAGGSRLAQLRRVREAFPVSLHGVGASLGGPAPARAAAPVGGQAPGGRIRARAGVGARGLVEGGRRLVRGPPSPAPHRRRPAASGGRGGPVPERDRAPHPDREPGQLPAVRERDGRAGLPERSRGTHRMRPPARREQRVPERPQLRYRPPAVHRSPPGRSDRGDPRRRTRSRREPRRSTADRHPRRPGERGGVGAAGFHARTPRPAAGAARTGRQAAIVRSPDGGAPPGRGGAGAAASGSRSRAGPVLDEYTAAFARYLRTGTVGALSGFCAGDADLSRLRVYRNGFLKACIEALRASYPSVERLVGEERFPALARPYVEAHPPRAAGLVEYGEDFPRFIEDARDTHRLDWLASFAALDRAWSEVCFAEDPDPGGAAAGIVPAGDVPGDGAEALMSLRGCLSPWVRLVPLEYRALHAWSELRQGGRLGPGTEVRRRPQQVLNLAKRRRDALPRSGAPRAGILRRRRGGTAMRGGRRRRARRRPGVRSGGGLRIAVALSDAGLRALKAGGTGGPAAGPPRRIEPHRRPGAGHRPGASES